jgi:hypothetical protein
LELTTVREKLFNFPGRLFSLLSKHCFVRGMPIPNALQRQDVVMVLKQAVAYDGLDLDDRKDTPEAWIKEIIRRNGWLHAEQSNY